MRRASSLAWLVLALACNRARPSAAPPDGSSESLVASRPYTLHVPPGLDPKTPAPLVVVLHGYGSTGRGHADAWGFTELADRERFLLVAPDGTLDAEGRRFWNATDACCNLFGATVDDVAYLGAIFDDVAKKTALDPKRVFVVGHSNGGFMAHRLACDMADRVAAIVSLAGATFKDPARCNPSSPVAVAEVHGTDDEIIRPEGGRVFDRPVPPYPSVAETMATWSAKLGCAPGGEPEHDVARLDLDARIAGAETHVDRWPGCRAALELWTIDHGGHAQPMRRAWAEAVWAFFRANPKR